MRFFTPEEDMKIAAEYQSGKMMKLIAMDLGRSESSIKTRLRTLGIAFNRNNQKAMKEVRFKVPRDILVKIDRAARGIETTRSRFVLAAVRQALEGAVRSAEKEENAH